MKAKQHEYEAEKKARLVAEAEADEEVGGEGCVLPGYSEMGAFALPAGCEEDTSRMGLKLCDNALRKYKAARETELKRWREPPALPEPSMALRAGVN